MGPNTGGMGAIAPAHTLSTRVLARVEHEILRPTIVGMQSSGAPFRGVLFAGIMITENGDPVLLEHNVRFGDPECQVLMALLDGDIADLLVSAARGALSGATVRVVQDRTAITVILASDGYPGSARVGDPIRGIRDAEAIDGVQVHHAGTAERDGVPGDQRRSRSRRYGDSPIR